MTLAHFTIRHLICLVIIFFNCFRHFRGHLNGHNNDFLVLWDASVFAVPFLVHTVNVLKNECLLLMRHSHSSERFIFVTISCIEHYERSSVRIAFSDTY